MYTLDTVELIVEEADWRPNSKCLAGDTIVEIKAGWGEVEVGRQVRRAGGKWNPRKKVWELRYDQVVKLGLRERLVGYIDIDAKKSI